MHLFPWAVATLDIGAAVVYVLNKQYALAVTWACYAVAAVSLSLVTS